MIENPNKEDLTPIIRGSVVLGNNNKYPFKRLSFDRKLKMLRVDIYTMLCLSQSIEFVKSRKMSTEIKQAVIKLVQKG